MNLAFLCLCNMKRFKPFLLVSLVLLSLSCSDDAVPLEGNVNLLEPVDDAVRLQSIAINNEAGDAITTFSISYNDLNLIEQIVQAGDERVSYDMTYTRNNQLTSMEQLQGQETTLYTLKYSEDQVEVTVQQPNGDIILTELSLDLQNRIDRAVTYKVLSNGDRALLGRVVYNYTENFNVTRIDRSGNNGQLQTSSSLDYVFNINPFRDMNDLVRFLIFEDFVPYTRYLPFNQQNSEVVNGIAVLMETIDYSYTLQANNFPSSRLVVSTTPAGMETITSQTFTYLP